MVKELDLSLNIKFQVSCLDDVCGMLPFMRRRRPDQLYRAWTSLFVHAGGLHLIASLALQWLFMRDLEKMAGPVRIAVVYLGSGVAGNMASAIFEPYRAEVILRRDLNFKSFSLVLYRPY